jgi:uncharacterized protein
MQPSAPPSELAQAIEEIRLADTHEHLGLEMDDPDVEDSRVWARGLSAETERPWVEQGPADVLQDLFFQYAQADLLVAGASPDAVRRALDPSSGDLASRFGEIRAAWEGIRHTGFGEAVGLVASEAYGLAELTPEGLEGAQSRLDALRQPGAMLRLLRDDAGLDHVQCDLVRCEVEADPTAPEFFLRDISWWKFANGEVDLGTIFHKTGIEVRTVEELRAAFASLFDRSAACAIAVKSQHAYNRTLRWEERSDEEAQRALRTLRRAGGRTDAACRLVLGDWCLARGVELAIEHDLPFKLHTGLYSETGYMPIDRIRAGHLCGLLQRYPEARFVLMHIAYPYSDELVAIAKHYPNVWVDLCWAWSADPYSTADFVRRFLHAVPANKLFAFGGDVASPTHALAAARQARRWLTRTLAAEVVAGDLTEAEAIAVARCLMSENQAACFDLEGTRAAAAVAARTGLA